MSGISVTTDGKSATITIEDPAKRQEIYAKLADVDNKKPAVAFRRDDEEIVLVFSDNGEITLDVKDFMTDLEKVEDAGGAFYAYADNPDPQKTNGGGPENPPPPNTMCPC